MIWPSTSTAYGAAARVIEDVGMPYEKILRESQRYDLILLGHETHFHFPDETRTDDTLWSVLKQTPRPVVTVPVLLTAGTSVVVAYNGSPEADRALQAFRALELHLGEAVYVLAIDSDEGAATRQAETAAEYLRAHRVNAFAIGLKPRATVAHTILEEVRQRNARLLVMGAYGHSTFREVLFGSVTDAVLKSSPAPVLLSH